MKKLGQHTPHNTLQKHMTVQRDNTPFFLIFTHFCINPLRNRIRLWVKVFEPKYYRKKSIMEAFSPYFQFQFMLTFYKTAKCPSAVALDLLLTEKRLTTIFMEVNWNRCKMTAEDSFPQWVTPEFADGKKWQRPQGQKVTAKRHDL